MARPDEFRELLFADVALLKGHAAARQVAAALLKYWDRRERTDTTLDEELAKIAGLTREQLTEIAAEVDRLVAASEGDPQLALTKRGGLAHELHTAVSRKDADASRQLTQLGAGIRVGLRTLPKDRYLDFMPVGEGGMGIVYWALDTELSRQVAFKVVRPPVDGPRGGVTPPAPVMMRAPDGGSELAEAFEELKARFLQEAWVTGGMEHPGIVPVYELGRTEGGVPYYTMRFVRGRRTLETAIEELDGRPFEERISLLEPFLKICDAISYAHNRGVVHRDLKPANVALGEYGETIVLDWGLAKLSGHPDVHASRWQAQVQDFRDTTDMATMTSALGTPGYMAPEAAAGEVDKVDQLADVYSLGSILFEIITGRLPIEFKDFREYADRLLAEDAPAASSIDATIPAALDSLCASALARDRNLRPAGARELAHAIRTWQKQSAQDREFEVLLAEADGALSDTGNMTAQSMLKQSERAMAACQRVLDHRPGDPHARELLERARNLRDVGARTKEELKRKALIRRVAIATLVALVVVGGVVAWVLEQRRQEAEEAREVARVERDNAAQQRARAEEAMGFITADLRELLEPEGRLAVLAEMGEKTRAHFAAIPVQDETPKSFRQRMRALRQLGEVYLAQGNLARAKEVFQQAVEASDAYAAGEAASDLAGFESGRAHVNLARVDHAQGYPRRGSQRVEAVVERLAGARPDAIDALEWDAARVRALNAYASALRGIPEYERARDVIEESLRLAGSLRDRDDARLAHAKLAIETALRTASARLFVGDTQGTVAVAGEALADAKRLRDAHPNDLTLRALQYRAVYRLAWAHRYTGSHKQAETLLADALPEVRALVALRPDNFRWRGLLMQTLVMLAEAKGGPLQEWWKAPAEFREAYALAEELHGRDPSHAGWINTLVNLCDRRAVIAFREGDSGKERAREFRARAAQFAERLAALEPSNARWRYLLAFTLGTLADQTTDAGAALKLLDKAKEHTAFALERIPLAQDVNDFWGLVEKIQQRLIRDPKRRLEVAAQTFEGQLKTARDTPTSYWAHEYVVRMLEYHVTWMPALGADAKAQLRKEATAALEWYAQQEARRDELDSDIAADLASWSKRAEAVRAKAGG